MPATGRAPGSLAATIASVRDARPVSVWLDRQRVIAEDDVRHSLTVVGAVDLAVVGGGFTGLWAAIEGARKGLRVVVIDGAELAAGASGRCGGFINSSITHGVSHGNHRWPDEMSAIVAVQNAMWHDTLALLAERDRSEVIEPCGKLTVAVASHHLAGLTHTVAAHHRWGYGAELLSRDATRAFVDSPTYRGGVFLPDGNGLCDPVGLAGVLVEIAQSLGVEFVEGVTIDRLDDERTNVRLAGTTSGNGSRSSGSVVARRAILATNAHRALDRRPRRRVIPVYDHVIATAPLTTQQWDDIGWHRRCGVTDAGNRFHYYRPTPDGRILFGGWNATYHFGGRVDARYERSPETHELLSLHLVDTFPALAGVEISHAWGGPIDSTSRFTPTFGTSMGGKLAWAVGFTGLGVGSSRFAAMTALDLLDGVSTERTELSMVRTAPIPFPPEPIRSVVVAATKRALLREDETGRRGLWLRLLDRFGVGFDT